MGKNIYEPGTRNIIGHTSDAKKKQQEDKGGKGGILKSKAQRVSKVRLKNNIFKKTVHVI